MNTTTVQKNIHILLKLNNAADIMVIMILKIACARVVNAVFLKVM